MGWYRIVGSPGSAMTDAAGMRVAIEGSWGSSAGKEDSTADAHGAYSPYFSDLRCLYNGTTPLGDAITRPSLSGN